jgi:hypothetical protein
MHIKHLENIAKLEIVTADGNDSSLIVQSFYMPNDLICQMLVNIKNK